MRYLSGTSESARPQAGHRGWKGRPSILWAVLGAALLFVQVDPASAHSPVFAEDNHRIATAYRITDPAKSWAIYAELEREDTGDYYSFELGRGDRIQLSLIVPGNV